MQQDKEEQLLKKRLTELAGLCWQRDIQTHSGFLTLREQTVFHSIERELAPVRVRLAGGYPQAERKMVCFLASYEEESAPLPIRVLSVVPAAPRFAQPLTHRDYLGAVMNLGIERSCVGDILAEENGCFIFCLEAMEEFLCRDFRGRGAGSELERVGAVKTIPPFSLGREMVTGTDCIIITHFRCLSTL